MSDNWIILIPEDPRFVPTQESQDRALDRFFEIAPEVDEIEIGVDDNIVFHDCGCNFQRILCPSCRSEVSVEWWQAKMDQDFDNGYKLEKYLTPCCGKPYTLHELIYDWPQGFGLFALDAMNPSIGSLDEKYRREFEEILGTPLRVIYNHF